MAVARTHQPRLWHLAAMLKSRPQLVCLHLMAAYGRYTRREGWLPPFTTTPGAVGSYNNHSRRTYPRHFNACSIHKKRGSGVQKVVFQAHVGNDSKDGIKLGCMIQVCLQHQVSATLFCYRRILVSNRTFVSNNHLSTSTLSR